jgi:hypothetical protein
MAEVSKIVSTFTRLSENVMHKESSLCPLLSVCLEYIRRIERLALNPRRSSTACDIFSIQLSLFLISEWVHAFHASQQSRFSIIDESGTHWGSLLDSLMTEKIGGNTEVNQSAVLPFAKLRLQTYRMLDEFFSLLHLDEGHVKWIALLRRCKELGEKCARLVTALEDPYFIPDFLEFLWSCIDERGHYLAPCKQHRRVCVMLLTFPSIFQGVAALAMENMRSDDIVPSQKDHRFYASLVSVDSLIHAIIGRVLLLHKSKNPSPQRQLFDGLLLAPCVAPLSPSLWSLNSMSRR